MEAINFFSVPPIIHVAGGQRGLQLSRHANKKDVLLTARVMLHVNTAKCHVSFTKAAHATIR